MQGKAHLSPLDQIIENLNSTRLAETDDVQGENREASTVKLDCKKRFSKRSRVVFLYQGKLPSDSM